jgi:predicted transcriptional regulator
MKPNANTPAAQRALQLICDTPAGLTINQIAAALNISHNHMRLCLSALSRAGAAKPTQDGERNTLWLTPERSAALTQAVRLKRKVKKRLRARELQRQNPRVRPGRPQKVKKAAPQVFSFKLSDEELEAGRRAVVSANDALPILTRAPRWVFDLGNAA